MEFEKWIDLVIDIGNIKATEIYRKFLFGLSLNLPELFSMASISP
jgi:hypothetical protein